MPIYKLIHDYKFTVTLIQFKVTIITISSDFYQAFSDNNPDSANDFKNNLKHTES